MSDDRIMADINPVYIMLIILVSVSGMFISMYLFDILTSSFDSQCNELYGKNNWSVYGADFIDFAFDSDHPVYFDAGHTFTCFKTGTTP